MIKSHVLYRLSYGLECADNALLMWGSYGLRKRPSEKVQIAATYIGMTFVLCLALLVFYLDLFVHHVIG